MGNPSISRDAFRDNKRVAPPIAPPAQPGEVRGCLSCVRCNSATACNTRDGYVVACEWQGEWYRPIEGCDRWAQRDTPLPKPA